MKYSVSSYSYSQIRGEGGKKEIELIALAKEMGFDAIEFAEIYPADGEDKIEYAKTLKAEAERVGIAIAAYCIGSNMLKGEEEVERLYKEVLVCEALGAPVMRHDGTNGYNGKDDTYIGFENALPVLVENYRKVTEFAEKHGVKTCIENHGFYCQGPERIERIVNGVNHPNFGTLVDIGNFMCAEADPAYATGMVAPYAFHVHAKDFIFKTGNGFNPGEGFFRTRSGNYLRGTIIGQGVVPLVQCISNIKRSGYDGYITVEFEGMENCLDGIRIGLENLKRAVESC